MQISQRPEFDVLLEKLYAGFNMPISDSRKEAYWDGLAKMSLGQFAAAVEASLGEEGPERIPAVPALWKISKGVRHKAEPLPPPKAEEPDRLGWFANRLLLMHLIARGGFGSVGRFVAPYGLQACEASTDLSACLKVKADMVEFYREAISESNSFATPFDFVVHWVKAIGAVSVIAPATLAHYRKIARGENAKKPFPMSMAA